MGEARELLASMNQGICLEQLKQNRQIPLKINSLNILRLT
jgi:hypothetical protein